MTNTNIVTIDGQQYDAVTGLPIKSSAEQMSAKIKSTSSKPAVHHTPATSLHSKPQRSTTLHRKAIKKPIATKHAIIGHNKPKMMDIARPHAQVRKFAPHPAGVVQPKVHDVGPVAHPHVVKAHAKSEAKQQSLTHSLTAHEIKEQAVKAAVAKTSKKPPLKQGLLPKQRIISVVSACLVVVMLGGYFTYLNMPSLSVRVAAAQAGIDAGYPNYRPDGYGLNGPVTYSDGKVSMNFKAHGGNQAFTINQSQSSWNSDALLDNYISPRAGSDYIPYTERGLTIYTYGDNAAWVNGGILYTIEGDAPLSSSQLRRIATSLL